MFEHTSQAHGWHSFRDLFRQLSTALGTGYGDKDAATIRQCAVQAIKERERYAKHFGVAPPADVGKHEIRPCYPATFIRRPRQADVGDDEAVPECEALPGLFGAAERPFRRAFPASTTNLWDLPDFGHRGNHPKALFTVSQC